MIPLFFGAEPLSRPSDGYQSLFAMHLLANLLSISSLVLPRQEPTLPANFDVGYWDLFLSGGSSSSGYSWHDVYSTYSGTPNVTVHCTYTKGPTTSAAGETLCDEMVSDVVISNTTSFRYQWNGASGLHNMTIQQTVEIVVSGVKTLVNITGTAPVDFGCGLGFNRLASSANICPLNIALVYRPREPPAALGPSLTPIPLTADSSGKANEQKFDCGRVIKGGANGLRDHRLNSAVHNKDTTKRVAKRTVTKKKGTASSSSSDGATGTWAVDKTSYRPRYMGSGGGMDWSICDKDCGWCGSCMDTAIVVWD
ncbi:hypothetical protein B0T16DRAFT_514511 [Cercophora newfieldiana]|uniref:Uncharacterized protein n=1 Tax=Cercophora newfieldiana TaxID=92897 RepID=A0AA39XUS4_9PEZI|nr:hypothetical protein B0T16DRAFT_514511 [Cercophora newfieldiana]